MNLGKNLYRMLMAASRAQAQWDYETSMNILKDKKRLYLLGLMLAPAILTSLAFAAGLPDICDGGLAVQIVKVKRCTKRA